MTDEQRPTSEYARATWRLLLSTPTSGAMNMAVDEAILSAVAAGRAPPTLRFYAWEPPCLSLGRAQKASDVDPNALQAADIDLVRRPTGGKAILHIDELTYSIVAPETEPRVAGGIVESYRRLSAGLISGLEKLGIADIVSDRRAENRRIAGPVCFEFPSDYEITVGGKKLVGSAQMRAQGAVLQHGALPLHGDIARICPLLAAHPDPVRVRARATTVEAALGRRASWDEVAAALAAGFAEALNLHLEPGPLTEKERAQAERLRGEKHGTQAWIRRR
jgi:lipoate-protein ligase A